MYVYMYFILQIAGEVFNANKLILASNSSFLRSIFNNPRSKWPEIPKLIRSIDSEGSICLIQLNFDSRIAFEHFLHLMYGGQVIVKNANKMEVPSPHKATTTTTEDTPNTSFTSGDDVDWTAMYDQFGGSKSSLGVHSDIITKHPSLPHTPERGYQAQKCDPAHNGAVRVFETKNWKKDLSLLKDLAVAFQVQQLEKK